jgi:hypothetical protein
LSVIEREKEREHRPRNHTITAHLISAVASAVSEKTGRQVLSGVQISDNKFEPGCESQSH